MEKRTLRDVDVLDKRVLMRVDFNVPLREDRTVADDGRIRAAIPSIRYVLDQGGTAVLMSHLGRPKGSAKPEFSLRPVAERLGELLDMPVHFLEDCAGPEIEKRVAALPEGEVALLENLRFHAEETANDPEFSASLARLGDVYVNDAFGTAHRAHASTVGVTEHFMVRAAGFLMEKEIDHLSRLLDAPERPFTAVLGGAKISGKIDVIRNLAGKVDRLLIGGGMAGTFYAAKGWETGDSLVEEDRIEIARELIASLGSDKLVLPPDGVAARDVAADAERRIVAADKLERGWRILDIGPETVKRFAAEVENSRTVFWNGPMGVFEMEPFAEGTRALAESMARATENGAATVIGGGDSARAIREAGFAGKVTHVSTGGGASLEFVEGKELPGVAVLTDR